MQSSCWGLAGCPELGWWEERVLGRETSACELRASIPSSGKREQCAVAGGMRGVGGSWADKWAQRGCCTEESEPHSRSYGKAEGRVRRGVI